MSHWQAVVAFNIFTEIILALTSIYLVWSLQQSFAKKAMVVFAFDLRLFVIVPIAFHLYYISDSVGSNDPTLRATFMVVSKQAEISYAIIAASIPCLRPFILATVTHYGAPAEGPRAQSGSTSKLSNIKKLSSRLIKTTSNVKTQDDVNTDPKVYYATETHIPLNGIDSSPMHTSVLGGRPQDAASVGSNDSAQMIIRKDVQYIVEHDYRSASR